MSYSIHISSVHDIRRLENTVVLDNAVQNITIVTSLDEVDFTHVGELLEGIQMYTLTLKYDIPSTSMAHRLGRWDPFLRRFVDRLEIQYVTSHPSPLPPWLDDTFLPLLSRFPKLRTLAIRTPWWISNNNGELYEKPALERHIHNLPDLCAIWHSASPILTRVEINAGRNINKRIGVRLSPELIHGRFIWRMSERQALPLTVVPPAISPDSNQPTINLPPDTDLGTFLPMELVTLILDYLLEHIPTSSSVYRQISYTPIIRYNARAANYAVLSWGWRVEDFTNAVLAFHDKMRFNYQALKFANVHVLHLHLHLHIVTMPAIIRLRAALSLLPIRDLTLTNPSSFDAAKILLALHGCLPMLRTLRLVDGRYEYMHCHYLPPFISIIRTLTKALHLNNHFENLEIITPAYALDMNKDNIDFNHESAHIENPTVVDEVASVGDLPDDDNPLPTTNTVQAHQLATFYPWFQHLPNLRYIHVHQGLRCICTSCTLDVVYHRMSNCDVEALHPSSFPSPSPWPY